MEQLTSYQVHFSQRTSMEEVVNLYEYMKSSCCDLYLYQEQLIADASNLPKLLSFFFYYNTEKPIVMIIDGKEVERTFHKIMTICEEPIKECSVRSFYDPHKSNTDRTIVV